MKANSLLLRKRGVVLKHYKLKQFLELLPFVRNMAVVHLNVADVARARILRGLLREKNYIYFLVRNKAASAALGGSLSKLLNGSTMLIAEVNECSVAPRELMSFLRTLSVLEKERFVLICNIRCNNVFLSRDWFEFFRGNPLGLFNDVTGLALKQYFVGVVVRLVVVMLLCFWIVQIYFLNVVKGCQR